MRSMARQRRQHLRVTLFREGTGLDDGLRAGHPLVDVPLSGSVGMTGRLLVARPVASPPSWLGFLEAAAEGALPVLTNQLTGAVLLVEQAGRTWALTFGLGHLYLNEDKVEPRFGLRTVLNVVDPERLLAVGSRVYEDVVVSTSRQASRRATREVFTIDDTRDILREVVGAPRDETKYGRQVVGSSALSLSVPVEAPGIAGFIEDLAAAHARDEYKRHFGFVDFIEPVKDRPTRARLDQLLLDVLTGRSNGEPYLAPPVPIGYDDVEGFLHTHERLGSSTAHPELDLDDYYAQVDRATLTVDDLKGHDVRLISASTGHATATWSVYRCLIFEAEVDERLFLLSEGEWFGVDRDFVARVDHDVGAINVVDLGLPAARSGEKEADYNRRAAASADFALLDKRLFEFGRGPIEVCDLLSLSGRFIHIKRKTQSATLSHLFAQGRVAAEALKVDAALRDRVHSVLVGDGRREAAVLATTPFSPRDKTVVYAVIAKNATELPAKLPFFSRLNLWRACRFLATTLDYQVEFCPIPVL